MSFRFAAMPDREAAYAAARDALSWRTLTDEAADLVQCGRLDIEDLAAAANAEAWAWDALALLAPDRAASILRPRKRGRPANTVRDAIICMEVKHRLSQGEGKTAAYKATATGYAIAWNAVFEIWKKNQNK